MPAEFAKPRIFSSRCLGFEACRWNGETIPDRFVENLKKYSDFVTSCPEVEIGLGVPRDPIRIVGDKEKTRLMQAATGKDFSENMRSFSEKFLGSLEKVDGFILKDKSPSCGIENVKVYPCLEKCASTSRTSGFFGKRVLEKFPSLPVETEMRLTNYRIREHFLARLFLLARFRVIKESLRMKDLVEFHANNKLLIMAHSQKGLKILGNIAANREGKKKEDVFAQYQEHLLKALEKASRYTANINILDHALGFFKDKLSKEEKKFFLDTVEEYRKEKVPLSVPVSLLRSYIVRFGEKYLEKQTFFEPYPQDLAAISDSGKGRSY